VLNDLLRFPDESYCWLEFSFSRFRIIPRPAFRNSEQFFVAAVCCKQCRLSLQLSLWNGNRQHEKKRGAYNSLFMPIRRLFAALGDCGVLFVARLCDSCFPGYLDPFVPFSILDHFPPTLECTSRDTGFGRYFSKIPPGQWRTFLIDLCRGGSGFRGLLVAAVLANPG